MSRVVICGGGHLAHALAAVISVNHPTAILTRNPFARQLLIARTADAAIISEPETVTKHPRKALGHAEVVFLAVPAYAHQKVLGRIAPYLSESCWVGAVPGVGAFHEVAPKALQRRSKIFVTRESPFNCRIAERGSVVDLLGVAPTLGVATILPAEGDEAVSIVQSLINIPAHRISDPIVPMLRPVNILLHPIILLKLFAEQHEGFSAPPDLYSSWDGRCSELYLSASRDLEEIASALKIDPTEIQPVAMHYGTNSPEELAEVIRAIPSLQGLKTPCVEREGRFYIDPLSRIIKEDVVVGLAWAIKLARRVNWHPYVLRQIVRQFAKATALG